MRIIDKNTDYYDYLSHVYGVDNKVVYDRRGSSILSDEDLFHMIGGTWRRSPLYGDDMILVEVGYIQILILMQNIKLTEDSYQGFISCGYKLECVYTDNRNLFKQPLSIRRCSVMHRGSYGGRSPVITGNYDRDIIKVGESLTTCFPSAFPNPILKATGLTSIIDKEIIWKGLQNYISSLNNDQDVNKMTNEEKIINYGFDKKTSFRG